MKLLTLSAVAAMLLVAPAGAEDTAAPKGPPKRMGDEGVLPSTSTVGGHVPTVGAQPAQPGSRPLTPKGPDVEMGDEGKLPATEAGSGRVPEMTEPDK